MDDSSDSDLDDLNWSLKKRKQLNKNCHDSEKEARGEENCNTFNKSMFQKNEKFEELKKKSEQIRSICAHRQKITERRRAKKLIKKALRDPFVKELVEKEQNIAVCEPTKETEEKEWKEIKPYLTVNSHLQGPVSHGEWGPKSEVESLIDDAIAGGDFEKAEILSDTLANREFAGKIYKAYNAKRQHETNKEQEAIAKAKRMKNIRWTFDAKPRWELKGHM
ncbi:uncharacterized protein NPIL_259701 [Nephila pilipes]|uniref:Protein FAM204A n=1 Tax=Nephila pilipes TaxID=299642 RepID=A0A8X6QK57_NEPPI|nr:uncharacterized protein NPIL_259701 [Nephila pilipes]